MSAPTSAPVVVGVDDSRLGLSAVRLAAREAAMHDRPLRIVHSFNWTAEPELPPETELRGPTERLIAEAVETASRTEPTIEISSALIEGPALTTLLRESGSAALTVLGDGNLSEWEYVPPESLAVQLAARAGSTVLVAREIARPTGPVLVGVDGSLGSQAALDFAFDAATRRKADLIALWVWDPVDRPEGAQPETEEALAEALAPWQQKYPSVRVVQRVLSGEPTEVMVEQSREVELSVVSARGEQPWRGMLGAVSQSMLYHSPAPVVIVRSNHELYIQE